MTVVKVEHFIHTVFFGKCANKLIALVNYSVCIVVLVDFKGCTGELVVRIFLIHLSQGDVTHNELVDDFDFHDLSVLFDNNIKDCFIENKTDRLLNFTNYPLTIRDIGKRKTTIFCGSGSHQSSILCKVGFIFLEQADYCTCKTVAVFGSFHTLNRTIDKVVFNRLATVYRQGNGNDFLTFVFKGKLILIRVQDIMLIGCNFLDIVAAERKVGLNGCKSVLIKGDYFDKSVSRNGSATCGNEFFCGIQAKYYVLDFAVITDFKEVICFKNLLHRKSCFLSFVIERSCSFSNGYILSCVDQLNGVNVFADYITVRCFDFLNLVLAKIDFLALG